MFIITLLNEKGGVGKTTLATHIAAGLAIKGHRVVLVDADPQGHSTVMFGMDKAPILHDLLIRGMAFKDALRKIKPEMYSAEAVKGELYVIPTDASARVIPLMTSDTRIVRKRFAEIKDWADVVVFDTAPTPSLLHGSIYIATDSIIYPTRCSYLSFDGLAESLGHGQQANIAREDMGLGALRVSGIVPTMYRSSTSAEQHGLQQLANEFGAFVWRPIQQRTIYEQAAWARQVLYRYAPQSTAAREMWSNIVNRIEVA